MSKPTPLPWRVEGEDSMMDIPFIEIASGDVGPTYKRIAEVSCTMSDNDSFELSPVDWANAEYIVKAANLYPELVAFVEQIESGDYEIRDKILDARELLKKVRG